MLSDLGVTLRTINDLHIFRNRMKLLTENVYKGRKKFEETLNREFPSSVADIIKSYLHEEMDIAENKSLITLLREINEEIEKIKIITLTVAQSLTSHVIDDVNIWIKRNVGSDIVIEIVIEPDVIAGAAISYLGKYGDFTLAKKLQKVNWNKFF
jgi:F0F1-type ATP synthase delta subunit